MSTIESVPTDAPSSFAERAYRQLRDRLIMLEIQPGSPINDSALAQELGIGRTPVREAIKRLEIDHLVISYPRRGTFATTVDITELAEISEIRQQLEPLAARRAARMATPDLRSTLRQTAQNIRTLGSATDQHSLMRHDITVHRLIYKAAANKHLEESLIRYDNLATRIWCLVLAKAPSVTGHITEHIELIEAILDRNEERAARLALEHVTSFEETIRAVL